MGNYAEIHSYNRQNVENYTRKIFSFVRWSENEKLIIISNFDDLVNYDLDFQIPSEIIQKWEMKEGTYILKDQLYNEVSTKLVVKNGVGVMQVKIDTLTSFIFKVQE